MTDMFCFPKRHASKSINYLIFNVLLLLNTSFPKIIAHKGKTTKKLCRLCHDKNRFDLAFQPYSTSSFFAFPYIALIKGRHITRKICFS